MRAAGIAGESAPRAVHAAIGPDRLKQQPANTHVRPLSCILAGESAGSANPLAQTDLEEETGRVTFLEHMFDSAASHER